MKEKSNLGINYYYSLIDSRSALLKKELRYYCKRAESLTINYIRWRVIIERSIKIQIAAIKKIILIGAIAIMDEMKSAVGKPTRASSVTPLIIAKAAANELMQTTIVRIAGEIPNLLYSAFSQKADFTFDITFVVVCAVSNPVAWMVVFIFLNFNIYEFKSITCYNCCKWQISIYEYDIYHNSDG